MGLRNPSPDLKKNEGVDNLSETLGHLSLKPLSVDRKLDDLELSLAQISLNTEENEKEREVEERVEKEKEEIEEKEEEYREKSVEKEEEEEYREKSVEKEEEEKREKEGENEIKTEEKSDDKLELKKDVEEKENEKYEVKEEEEEDTKDQENEICAESKEEKDEQETKEKQEEKDIKVVKKVEKEEDEEEEEEEEETETDDDSDDENPQDDEEEVEREKERKEKINSKKSKEPVGLTSRGLMNFLDNNQTPFRFTEGFGFDDFNGQQMQPTGIINMSPEYTGSDPYPYRMDDSPLQAQTPDFLFQSPQHDTARQWSRQDYRFDSSPRSALDDSELQPSYSQQQFQAYGYQQVQLQQQQQQQDLSPFPNDHFGDYQQQQSLPSYQQTNLSPYQQQQQQRRHQQQDQQNYFYGNQGIQHSKVQSHGIDEHRLSEVLEVVSKDCIAPSQTPVPEEHINIVMQLKNELEEFVNQCQPPTWQWKCVQKKYLDWSRSLVKLSDESVVEKDEDGDTMCMIAACGDVNSDDYCEKLKAVVKRQQNIDICCDKLVVDKTCKVCGNTDPSTFYSSMGIRSHQGDTILCSVVKLQKPQGVIDYLLDQLRPSDISRIFPERRQFYYYYIGMYPKLRQYLHVGQ